MSVFNIKSTVIAQRDSTPPILSDPIKAVGRAEEVYGTEKLPTTPNAGSTCKLFQVPSGARLASLEYAMQGLGTSVLDVAVWYPNQVATQSSVVAGALISSSVFAANLAGVDAGVAMTDAMGLPSALALDKRTQPLWQMLGLVADPGINLDFGFSVRTANAIAGYVGLRARYVR